MNDFTIKQLKTYRLRGTVSIPDRYIVTSATKEVWTPDEY